MKSIRLSVDLRAVILAAPLAASACFAACITSTGVTGPSADGGTFEASFPGDTSGPDSTTVPEAAPPVDTGPAETGPVDTGTPPADVAVDAPADAGIDAPADAGPTTATLVGQVFDFMQLDLGILPGATVSVVGGPSTTTDLTGRFTLPGVTSGQRVLVNVSKPSTLGIAYSSTQIVVPAAAGQTVQLTAHLLEGCVSTINVSPTDASSTTLQAACASRTVTYASISFDPGALTESGSPFSGTARVEIIPIESPSVGDAGQDLTWFSAFPGDMSAAQLDGGTLPLQSLGACEFRVFDSTTDTPLTIATGHTATLEIPATRLPVAGESYTGYYYDVANGRWVEQGAGAFTTHTVAGAPVAVFQIQVPHLTWWNIDEGSSNEGCVVGKVSANGAPVANLLVSGTGVGWSGGGGGVTAADGTFCINGLGSSPMTVTATAQAAGATFVRGLGTLTTGAAGASCGVNPGACAVAPATSIVPLRATTPGCATGRVFKGTLADGGAAPAGIPLGIQYNFAGGGEIGTGEYGNVFAGTVTPASDGTFCVQYPPGVVVSLVDPTNNLCTTVGQREYPATFSAPPIAADAGAATCPTGCADAGTIAFFCGS